MLNKKWNLPWSLQGKENDFKQKHKNMLPVEYLWVIHAFMDTPEFEKLAEPTKQSYYRMYWELEYILGINEKPCVRCGDKPPHGEYYCDNCLHKEDHADYVIVKQKMHDEKYHAKERNDVKFLAEKLTQHKLKTIFGK